LLPTGCPGSRVDVKLETDRIRVTVKGARARRPPITFALSFQSTNHVARRPPRRSLTPSYSPTATGEDVIRGELYAPIKAEASTWLIADGVLELSLLKRNRRGNYENGSNNAETFWFSVVREDGGRRLAERFPRRDRPSARRVELPAERVLRGASRLVFRLSRAPAARFQRASIDRVGPPFD